MTHWSTRLLAARLGVDNSTAAQVRKHYGIRPWKAETFKFSIDPELEVKVVGVVGLSLAPPDIVIVLCVHERSQIQALDRTQKRYRCSRGMPSSAPTGTFGTAP